MIICSGVTPTSWPMETEAIEKEPQCLQAARPIRGFRPGRSTPVRIAESECADVVVEFRRAQSQGNLDRAHVAGIRQNIRDGQHAIFLVIVNEVPATVTEPFSQSNTSSARIKILVECRGKGHQFEGRAGLVDVADGAVRSVFSGHFEWRHWD